MDPKIDAAFLKVIRAYFEGVEPEESNKAQPDRKYNKKMLDHLEEKHLGKKTPKTDREIFEAKKKGKKNAY